MTAISGRRGVPLARGNLHHRRFARQPGCVPVRLSVVHQQAVDLQMSPERALPFVPWVAEVYSLAFEL